MIGSLCCWRRPSEEDGSEGKPPQDRSSRLSIYETARGSGLLSQGELEALREFESVADTLSDGGGDVFFDALGEMPDDPQYMPITHPPQFERGSIIIANPTTMLLESHLVEPPPKSRKRLGATSFVGALQRTEDGGPQDPGYPGWLTRDELDACVELRKKIDGMYDDGEKSGRDMIWAFAPVEEEAAALCRFLRARKFDVPATLKMIDDAIPIWEEAEKKDFFKDIGDAIGSHPPSVLKTQYPAAYHGTSKTGCAVWYFRAGEVSVEGIECLTSLSSLTGVAWNDTMTVLRGDFQKNQEKHAPRTIPCEVIAVVDLKGLRAATLNGRTLEVIKAAAQVNQCFPETMNSTIVMNAPGFFSFSWRIIKRFLDKRTVAKIAIYSDEAKARQWLREKVSEDELLSDYGGSGPSFEDVLRAQGDGKLGRRIVHLLHVPARDQEKAYDFALHEGESADVDVYSSGPDCRVAVREKRDPSSAYRDVVARKQDGVRQGTRHSIATGLRGPGEYTVRARTIDPAEESYLLVVGDVS